ncbi:MAG: 3-isopropylmalate dehydratase large subunit [Bacteroidetes bacterium GWE2_40_15]|nr:MAG: 3-isopropylmalate dehydratase large subunit [Bacteroidetes bacterium GWE2_40_15]
MKTLFDKIWESHIVKEIPGGQSTLPGGQSILPGGQSILYIDRHFIHEVTSPQAFTGLRNRGRKVFRPSQTFATCDHNVPTREQDRPIEDPLSRIPIEQLASNTKEHGITYFPLGDPSNGIVHIIGSELGITQPGMTIVCGDSHTSTHGAFGSIAFGIGTSEVEMVLATQTLLQSKPKQMLIKVDGELSNGVCAKDIILHIISRLGTSAGTGHFIEFAGSTIKGLTMEGRMTICNMSIEMGARGGMIAPDQKTFDYVKGREYSPKGELWESSVKRWLELRSDAGAHYDAVVEIDATAIEPMITWGTNPGMGMAVNGKIPPADSRLAEKSAVDMVVAGKSAVDMVMAEKALDYMGFKGGEQLLGHPVDYIFLGSCTNGRIEDFRDFAGLVKGRRKAPGVTAWLVPGSKRVERQIEAEGLGEILREAGFVVRQPGCSACLGMNEDKVPEGKYCISTTNRNFEGRQGPGARTILAGPLVAAASAITGVITDPRELVNATGSDNANGSDNTTGIENTYNSKSANTK